MLEPTPNFDVIRELVPALGAVIGVGLIFGVISFVQLALRQFTQNRESATDDAPSGGQGVWRIAAGSVLLLIWLGFAGSGQFQPWMLAGIALSVFTLISGIRSHRAATRAQATTH